ncbi:MAG: hypothetical protein HY223_09560 [Thaumarchaeota archaeon]|nr:hypothetical protein [Nitrososphaerota archaeon]
MVENKDMPSNDELLTMAIEDALNEMGEPTLEIVNNKLFQEYRCSLLDCVEHPDYLANVLKQTFGYAHVVIIKKIKKNIGEFASEKPVEEFIRVLSR